VMLEQTAEAEAVAQVVQDAVDAGVAPQPGPVKLLDDEPPFDVPSPAARTPHTTPRHPVRSRRK